MKLMIVEDDPSRAEVTAELLKSLGRPVQKFEAITLAGDLQTAISCLPGHDTVLCDGMFPISPESPFLVDDWDVVRQEAIRRGIHDAMGRQAEGDARSGHLYAFNFGRSLGRMELSHEQSWLRVRWLLFGAAAGVVIATILLHVLSNPRVLPLAR